MDTGRNPAAINNVMAEELQMTRGKEIVIGILMAVLGFVAVAGNWASAIYGEKYRPGAAIWSPLLFFAGIMLIAVPYPDKSKFPKAEHAPKAWAGFLAVGALFGGLNWYLMTFGF